jgi:hypothetical protein
VLKSPTATGQQLMIIPDSQPGVVQVLGAAGSGKTTTALLRLRALSRFWQRHREDGYLGRATSDFGAYLQPDTSGLHAGTHGGEL